MTIIKCKSCGHNISNKATACPACGHPVKRTSVITKGILWFIGLFFAAGIIGSCMEDKNKENTATTEAARIAALTPEQKKLEEEAKRIHEQEANKRLLRMTNATMVAKKIKQAMRDPDSFKLSSVLLMEKTEAICFEYRAKNGFGGTTVGNAIITAGKSARLLNDDSAGFRKAWNKQCANQKGEEVAEVVTRLASRSN